MLSRNRKSDVPSKATPSPAATLPAGRLSLRSLSRQFAPNAHALDRLSLDVQPGERLAIIGPSGAGKSTLLRVIAGLERLDSGEIILDDQILAQTPPWQRTIRLLAQEPALVPYWRVDRNVSFGRPVLSSDLALLDRLGLTGLSRRWPTELSGGQRQRVALARALRVRPRLLLLDEPFARLEPALRLDLRQMLATLVDELQISTLLVTHDPAEAQGFGHRLAVLIGGAIVQVDAPETVYRQPATIDAARLMGDPPMNIIPVAAFPNRSDFPQDAVSFGIHPEDLLLVRGEDASEPQIAQATVSAIDPRGAKHLVRLDLAGHSIHALVPYCDNSPGDTLRIACPLNQIVLFGIDGRRLTSD